MDGLSIILPAGLALLGAAAGGAALWQQRRLTSTLQRQLEHAESARRELAEQLRDIALTLKSDAAAGAPSDTEARRRALERVLDAANAQAMGPADFPWLETMPHEPPPAERYAFASTEPAALDRTVDIPLDRR